MGVKRIEEIYKEFPELRDFAKKFNKDRFEDIGFIIFSQPQAHPFVTIYGIFLFDKCNVKKNLIDASSRRDEIVQDFIAYETDTNKFTYYSGLGKHSLKSKHQHMNLFCRKFGKHPNGEWGQYGCNSEERTDSHRFDNENNSYLPTEKWVRDLIKTKIEELRSILREQSESDA